ncbi:hypothetical protein E2C01_061361 [Portunus trituberculatus]|uniref:Uncharacterized protein n=1 Tax=Portunus trituberculatus TaxID=210409 RepID=A0A5B7HEU5_PORTR|nr:hypothetical protein [Portunus trituberculatus]
MCVCVCLYLPGSIVQGLSSPHSVLSPVIQFFFKVMHIMCCNNFITQCIPLLHRSVWKTVFSNILHTLPHTGLYMSSCPIFCHQHQVFLVYLFNAIGYLVHCY